MKFETYVDAFNREWQIAVTPWEQDIVEARTGINLYDLVDHTLIKEESTKDDPVTVSSKLIGQLETDDRLLSNVMWTLCEPQATEQEVTEKEFIRGCSGEALDRAYLSLLGALANFFRRPEQRLAIKRIAEALNRVHEIQTKLSTEGIEKAMKQFDPEIFVKERSNLQQSQV